MTSKNRFAPLASVAAVSNHASQKALPRRGKSKLPVVPKQVYQPAFTRALKARVSHLGRRLTRHELVALSTSVRRGYNPPKSSPIPKRSGLGYKPRQKWSPPVADLKKVAPVKNFIKGKSLVGSLQPEVSKVVSTESLSEAKSSIAEQISIGARSVASAQERANGREMLLSRLSLVQALRKPGITSSEKFTLLSGFAVKYPKSLSNFVRVEQIARRDGYIGSESERDMVSKPCVYVDFDRLMPSLPMNFVPFERPTGYDSSAQVYQFYHSYMSSLGSSEPYHVCVKSFDADEFFKSYLQ